MEQEMIRNERGSSEKESSVDPVEIENIVVLVPTESEKVSEEDLALKAKKNAVEKSTDKICDQVKTEKQSCVIDVEYSGSSGVIMNAVEKSTDKLCDQVEPEKQSYVIDVICSSRSIGVLSSSTVCRICHLSSDCQSETSDLIQLGCGCKDDLGSAHRNCAEAWFQRKGDRCCEICGEVAKYIKGVEDTKFMDKWNEGRLGENGAVASGRRGRFWQGQPFCNFIMACLIIAFIVPWLFRANLFP